MLNRPKLRLSGGFHFASFPKNLNTFALFAQELTIFGKRLDSSCKLWYNQIIYRLKYHNIIYLSTCCKPYIQKGIRIMKMNQLFAGFSVLAFSAVMLSGCGGPPPNRVHSVDDLKGKHIGVQLGTTGDTLATELEDTNVEKYNTASEAVDALKEGKIDAVIVDLETANAFVEKSDDIRVLDEEFADEEYAIAVNLDNPELVEELNGALHTLNEKGVLSEIKANYEGDEKGQHPYELKTGVKRDKGTLVMATNAEFPPYESEENGLLVGIDIDMMNAVCDELGYELKINDMDFNDILPNVQRGDADVGVAGLSVTPEREEIVLFTDNYAVTHQVIVVRKK